MISKLPGLLQAAQIDQKTLATQTGLSPTTIGKIFRGHFDRIDNHTIKVLAKYFELRSISQLIEIEWEDGDGHLIPHQPPSD